MLGQKFAINMFQQVTNFTRFWFYLLHSLTYEMYPIDADCNYISTLENITIYIKADILGK